MILNTKVFLNSCALKGEPNEILEQIIYNINHIDYWSESALYDLASGLLSLLQEYCYEVLKEIKDKKLRRKIISSAKRYEKQLIYLKTKTTPDALLKFIFNLMLLSEGLTITTFNK